MPLAATVPNSASPAPPSTGRGIAAMTPPSFGTKPSASSLKPLVATTNRLRIPVMATRPTFWAKALAGNPLSNPPATALDSVSARRPPTTARASFCRSIPTISPMARMSAVVSVMITSITMVMETIAAISKVGVPKWNGVETASQSASPTRLKSVSPNAQATSVPSARLAKIATRLKKPGKKR
jgi:hypothetical protein